MCRMDADRIATCGISLDVGSTRVGAVSDMSSATSTSEDRRPRREVRRGGGGHRLHGVALPELVNSPPSWIGVSRSVSKCTFGGVGSAPPMHDRRFRAGGCAESKGGGEGEVLCSFRRRGLERVKTVTERSGRVGEAGAVEGESRRRVSPGCRAHSFHGHAVPWAQHVRPGHTVKQFSTGCHEMACTSNLRDTTYSPRRWLTFFPVPRAQSLRALAPSRAQPGHLSGGKHRAAGLQMVRNIGPRQRTGERCSERARYRCGADSESVETCL